MDDTPLPDPRPPAPQWVPPPPEPPEPMGHRIAMAAAAFALVTALPWAAFVGIEGADEARDANLGFFVQAIGLAGLLAAAAAFGCGWIRHQRPRSDLRTVVMVLSGFVGVVGGVFGVLVLTVPSGHDA